MKRLEKAVGEDVTSKVIKGCSVHFVHSVKRVSEQLNKGQPLAFIQFKAFTTLAYAIPGQSTSAVVYTLFDVLESNGIEAALPKVRSKLVCCLTTKRFTILSLNNLALT